MYTAEVLADIHQRAHESLRRLIDFLGQLPREELARELPGFGFATIMLQLEHLIGSELYWQLVVTTGFHEEPELPALTDLAAMEAFRAMTAAGTRGYLLNADTMELNTRRAMVTDPGETRTFRPADIILRMVTHIYSHQGQVLAMCRTLGRPNETHDVDYPLREIAV